MKDVIFIKAYVNLNHEQFNELGEESIYDGYRGIWKINKNKAKDIKYAFAIHHNIIKNVYKIHEWHDANTTEYKSRKIDITDPKIKERIEFTGEIAKEKEHFIGKNVSSYYSRGEANPIKYMELEQLELQLNNHKLNNLIEYNPIYPDDIKEEDEKTIYEGLKKLITVNKYERSSQARQKCIETYGTKCTICEFDFEKIYGEIGKNFIHVHHLKPLSEINAEYIINPIEDLRPVCPNCHSMLHTRKPAYTIEEIKFKINNLKLLNI